jgi:hypothetical protein
MPYSNYAVADRKAVSQLKYQIRRFCRQMEGCGTEQQDIDRISALLNAALLEAAGSVDFYDDGERMESTNAPA